MGEAGMMLTTYLHRLINAPVSLKDGFSVVAPIS